MRKMQKQILCLLLALCLSFVFTACRLPDATPSTGPSTTNPDTNPTATRPDITITGEFGEITIPAYSGDPYITVNNNEPFFTDKDLTSTEVFEYYSELDSLGRCGIAYANICKEIMPADGEERGEIGQVKPTGWHTATYPDVISDRYLYNRCHLIGWQLAGENANKLNLITGTRYLNIEGMLPFENMIDDYVDETNHHVLYRVTPYYTGDNLIADGVLMEAHSVEDNKLVFCIWAYNVQPYVYIDYVTGDSYQIDTAIPGIDNIPADTTPEQTEDVDNMIFDFILNTNSKKAHDETCTYAQDMSPENRQEFTGTFAELEDMGYALCKNCFGDKE